MYLLHSRLPAFKRKVERSMNRIREALETVQPWAVSYSGGVDSSVLLDLVFSVGYRPIITWQSYGEIETIPGNRRMVEWVKSHYGTDVYEHKVYGEIEVFKRVGYFFLEPTTKEERAAVKWWWGQSFGELDAFIRDLGAKGHYWGILSTESDGRQKFISHYGHLHYAKKHQLWASSPIHDWTKRDIWAYLVSRGLKWCDIYDHRLFNREETRNDFVLLAGDGAIRHGSFKFWETYDSEWWSGIVASCPEIKRYT